MPGVDQDIFDPYCEHLVVRDEDTGMIVGTYRILSPNKARAIGAYYSESEFDLTRLQHLRSRMVEIGRSCVHRDHRNGTTIAPTLVGTGQIHDAARLRISDRLRQHQHGRWRTCRHQYYHRLADHLSPIEFRVFPRCRLPMEALRRDMKADVPPLIKGYLRAGAYICGEPAWDPDSNTADLPILMPLSRISARYSKHFIETNDSLFQPAQRQWLRSHCAFFNRPSPRRNVALNLIGPVAEEMFLDLLGQILAVCRISQVQTVFVDDHRLQAHPLLPCLLRHVA